MHIAKTLLLFFLSNSLHAEQRSPQERDEDMSGAVVTVKIERPTAGSYRYIYNMSNPATSIAQARDFTLDVGCPELPDVRPPRHAGTIDSSFNLSRDGRHLATSVSVIGGRASDAGIDSRNRANAGIWLKPGRSATVVIDSVAKPGFRAYGLIPAWAEHQGEYDYSGVDETGQDDPSIPSSWDFEIHGVIPGPACEGQAATPMTRPIFDGQQMLDEGRENNQLLRYEVKGNRNRWYAPAATTEVKFRIYYSYDIDPASFVATLNGNDVTSRFDPVNLRGAYEEITLPLQGDRTRIEFRVCKADPAPNPETGNLPCDADPFEIRRP